MDIPKLMNLNPAQNIFYNISTKKQPIQIFFQKKDLSYLKRN